MTKSDRPRRLALAALPLLLLTGLFAGCASTDRGHKLLATTEQYNKRIRWGDFGGAVAYLHPDARPDGRRLEFMLDRFEQVRVSGYAPVGRAPSADEDSYIVVMELRLVNRHTLRERVVRDQQEWRYGKDDDNWWLMSGLPDISRD